MFDNIGGKIKILAKILCWLGIIASLTMGIFLMFVIGDGYAALGILVTALGPLFSWIGSFITYGLGQLIENSDTLVSLAQKNSGDDKNPQE